MTSGKMEACRKLRYKDWQRLKKKSRRKEKRQQKAQANLSEEKVDSENCYEENAKEDSEEERLRVRQNELWLQREREAQAAWEAKQEWIHIAEVKRIEQERKIKEEWEARKAAEKAEAEQKAKEEEEKKRRQDERLKEIIRQNADSQTHNPAPPSQESLADSKDICHFYRKTGACRFRDNCSRIHLTPEISRTLLLANMYTHPSLDDHYEYDTDVTLEYDDSDLYQAFKDFYYDVLPEFKQAGKVVQFKVCRNYEPHLRGNVYVQYTSENESYKAFTLFNGRWYSGKQVQCSFSPVEKWKPAICGMFHQKRCPKGKSCNFLHVFRNPDSEFNLADRDVFPQNKPRDRRNGSQTTSERRREGSDRYTDRSERRRESSPSRSDRHYSTSHRWSSDSDSDEERRYNHTGSRRDEGRDRRSSHRRDYYQRSHRSRSPDSRKSHHSSRKHKSSRKDEVDQYSRSENRSSKSKSRRRSPGEDSHRKKRHKRTERHDNERNGDERSSTKFEKTENLSIVAGDATEKEKLLREAIARRLQNKTTPSHSIGDHAKEEDWRYCRTPSVYEGSSPEYDPGICIT